MSRVGQTPIPVPSGVTVELKGGLCVAKGKLGERSLVLHDQIETKFENGVLAVRPRSDTLKARKMWGTTQRLLRDLLEGVSKGYSRRLEINGVGLRAQLQGKDLVMQLGFSHEVRYQPQTGIKIEVPEPTRIVISGSSRQAVGQTAAEIRSFRPPEPYKGKGIKYEGEVILRKEGKKK